MPEERTSHVRLRERVVDAGSAWWVMYHKKRALRGITAKLLFNESPQRLVVKEQVSESRIQVYEGRGSEPLTETIIRNDKIGIILLDGVATLP